LQSDLSQAARLIKLAVEFGSSSDANLRVSNYTEYHRNYLEALINELLLRLIRGISNEARYQCSIVRTVHRINKGERERDISNYDKL